MLEVLFNSTYVLGRCQWKGFCMQLSVLSDKLAVCRLSSSEDVPSWVWGNKSLVSVTYTADELSTVCASENVPDDVQCEREWRAMKVQGPLDFALTGILAALAGPLAEAGIAIFALSTYDTDYILVKEDTLQQAVTVLQQHGHVFEKGV
jgi:hypothetical protein